MTAAPPPPGTVYGFATKPSFGGTGSTGRFGAVKVLGGDALGRTVLGVLDGVFAELPALEEVTALTLLAQYRFGNFDGQLAVFATETAMLRDPELVALGVAPLTDEEVHLGETEITTWSAPGNARLKIEGEWRWRHDRPALEADGARKAAEDAEKRRLDQERFESRLKDLTWEQLLSEHPFERWDPSPPFPSADFTAAAEARVHESMRDLQLLGAKPNKRSTRAVLKALVTWLNQADEAAGNPIETEEREDLMRVLGEMAFVARHPTLVDEVDAWRDW